MNCPKCNGEFETRPLGYAVVEQCRACGGYWFDGGDLDRAQDGMDADVAWMDVDLWKDEQAFNILESELFCPKCKQKKMAAVQYGPTSVTVDTCPDCKGVWLDAGEFEQILQAVREQAEAMDAKHLREAALHEATKLVGSEKGLSEEWHELTSILRMWRVRVMVEKPKLRESILAFYQASPFK